MPTGPHGTVDGPITNQDASFLLLLCSSDGPVEAQHCKSEPSLLGPSVDFRELPECTTFCCRIWRYKWQHFFLLLVQTNSWCSLKHIWFVFLMMKHNIIMFPVFLFHICTMYRRELSVCIYWSVFRFKQFLCSAGH